MKNLPLVYVLEDDEIFANLIADDLKRIARTKVFHEAITAISEITKDQPALIFLDIMLTGPDGFTFLNELISYEDTSKIPIIILSSLDFKDDLSDYGVKKVLSKDTVTPEIIRASARELLNG